MSKVTPFLWFQVPLDEPIAFYKSVFSDMKVHMQSPQQAALHARVGLSAPTFVRPPVPVGPQAYIPAPPQPPPVGPAAGLVRRFLQLQPRLFRAPDIQPHDGGNKRQHQRRALQVRGGTREFVSHGPPPALPRDRRDTQGK